MPKAGLMLMDLQTSPNAQPEQDLDVPRARLRKPDGRAQCLDHALRARFDPARQRQRRRGWVRPGLDDEQELKTPDRTTRWKDLPRAQA